MYFDFSSFLSDSESGILHEEFYESDALHFSDKGYAEIVTPFIAGAIRMISHSNLPPHYLQNILNWQRYLCARYTAANANFALEEQLGLTWHLKCIAPFWMKQFQKLEKDLNAQLDYPEELVRQSNEEKLPPSAGIIL